MHILDGCNLGCWTSQKQHAPSTFFFKGEGRVRLEILNYVQCSSLLMAYALFWFRRNGPCYK